MHKGILKRKFGDCTLVTRGESLVTKLKKIYSLLHCISHNFYLCTVINIIIVNNTLLLFFGNLVQNWLIFWTFVFSQIWITNHVAPHDINVSTCQKTKIYLHTMSCKVSFNWEAKWRRIPWTVELLCGSSWIQFLNPFTWCIFTWLNQ